MTASQFIDQVCKGSPDPRKTILYLHRHMKTLAQWIYAVETEDKRMLCDLVDVKDFAERVAWECSRQLGKPVSTPTLNARAFTSIDDFNGCEEYAGDDARRAVL